MKFEWDERKAAANRRKHDVSFDQASIVLQDPNLDERIDDSDDYGEERLIGTGMALGSLVTVIYTMREDCYPIISARRATRHEKQDYYLKIRP
jgi:uncharacterized protein